MSQQTFNYLCERLQPAIEKQCTKLHQLISVKKQVAITLWCLATPMEYRSTGHLFGVACCTGCIVVHETCAVIIDIPLKSHINFPRGNLVDETVEGFQKTWGVPQCCGAIDGLHIPTYICPCDESYNRKEFYSVVVQAVIDYKCRLLDVHTGWPGSVHDVRVFAHSSLYKLGVDNKLLPDTRRVIEGTEIPLYFVGDSAYPLLTWLMKPFPDFPHNDSLSMEQRTYNYHICRARIVVENADGGGYLKGSMLMLRRYLPLQLYMLYTSQYV